ncbi:MAG: Thivi_2564 family membrane protein [Novosphingobium sp.]
MEQIDLSVVNNDKPRAMATRAYKTRRYAMLINIVIALVVVGVVLWLINTYIPMDGKIKSILNVVIVIAVVIWLLRAFSLV